MAYWHKLSTHGWTCDECGSQQYGEYYCEDCASEAGERRARRDEIIDRGRAHPIRRGHVLVCHMLDRLGR